MAKTCNVTSHGNTECACTTDHAENNKNMLYLIILGLVLFTMGLILKYYYIHNSVITIILFLAAYTSVGWKVLKGAVINTLHGNIFEEQALISIATVGAFAIGMYGEGVAVMLFYSVGDYMQQHAIGKSRQRIKSLLSLKVMYANIKKYGKIKKVRVEDVKVGDIIVIKPGDRVPLDGVIIKGSSMIDTSALTGESIPKTVQPGDEVFSGMINMDGVLYVKVKKEESESTISKILALVEEASKRKASSERFITKFARHYTPVIVALALLTAIVPPLILNEGFDKWLYRALVLLVISCPCALVLSIPVGYFIGIGKGAKEGILIKGSNYLDSMRNVKTLAIDKTGTLTKGLFKVVDIEVRNGFNKDEIIRYAAIAEYHSSHPIAKAIIDAYGKSIDSCYIEKYNVIGGHGIVATIDGKEIIVGNDRLLHKYNIKHDTCNVAGTVVHVVVDKKYSGYIIISDEIKGDASEAIIKLKSIGVKRIVMVTGDNVHSAKAVAQRLGIDEYYADLLPEDKVRVIEKLETDCQSNEKIGFVGDGINDAPVIARADVGIAMGALGTEAAIESADIVIMDDKLSKIPIAIKIAKKTHAIVWQNIAMALGIKFMFIILGIMGIATMWGAVFADVGVTIIAVANAIRIL